MQLYISIMIHAPDVDTQRMNQSKLLLPTCAYPATSPKGPWHIAHHRTWNNLLNEKRALSENLYPGQDVLV